jgi:hypothetical protein
VALATNSCSRLAKFSTTRGVGRTHAELMALSNGAPSTWERPSIDALTPRHASANQIFDVLNDF